MSKTPSESFAACYRICGESVVPSKWTEPTFNYALWRNDSDAIALGIVHLQAWLLGKGCELRFVETDSADHKDQARNIKCFTLSGVLHEEKFYPFENDSASSLFTALCSLAGRVGGT